MLYPNFVKKGQDVIIRLSDSYNKQHGHMVVYDLQGRAVISKTLELTESIKLFTNQLTKGLYFVHLSFEDSSKVFKLIVD